MLNKWVLFAGAGIMLGLGIMYDSSMQTSSGLVLMWIGLAVN